MKRFGGWLNRVSERVVYSRAWNVVMYTVVAFGTFVVVPFAVVNRQWSTVLMWVVVLFIYFLRWEGNRQNKRWLEKIQAQRVEMEDNFSKVLKVASMQRALMTDPEVINRELRN